MKILIMMLVAAMFSINASAVDNEPLDKFPWDWGTECPFPWDEIDGEYVVTSISGDKKMDGTRLKLVSIDPAAKHVDPILEVFHYNKFNRVITSGIGVGKESDRIITAYTKKPSEEKSTSKIYIRTYVAEVTSPANKQETLAATCQKQTQVVTATFCSLYGRKCKDTENYILEKIID